MKLLSYSPLVHVPTASMARQTDSLTGVLLVEEDDTRNLHSELLARSASLLNRAEVLSGIEPMDHWGLNE